MITQTEVAEQTKEIAEHTKTVAIIPAYNEARFIASVVLVASKYVDVVIVVDDGSNDATAELATRSGALVLRHETNRGKGAALNTGFQKARELGATAVTLLDGDGQHRPDDIPRMIKPILDGESDMVVGSRFLDLKSEIPFYRLIGQSVVTTVTGIASSVSSTDSWSGYRAFSRRAIEVIHFREGGWGVDPEFQFLAREHNLNVSEVPIIAIYEEKAKRNPIPHGLKTINAIVRLTGQHRPLLFFGLVGFLVLVAGFGTGIWVVDRYTRQHELAVGIALISVMLMVLGTLSLFTGIMLHSIRGLLLDMYNNLSMMKFNRSPIDQTR
jgi:glycosyltransferase involved in cell wall biosynthesis